MSTRLKFTFGGALVVVLVVGLTLSLLGAMGIGFNAGVNATTTNPDIQRYSGQPAVVVEMSYAAVSFEEMIERANVILTGQVTKIGETRWNQDSGAYWEEIIKDENDETTVPALPYYEVTISPEQIIADSFGIKEDQLVITVLGPSPTDYQITDHDYRLKSGDEIIAFVKQGEIAWWNGKVTYNKETSSFESGRKLVLLFMGAPNNSYLLKGQDGLYRFLATQEQSSPLSLGELTKLIQEKRGMP